MLEGDVLFKRLLRRMNSVSSTQYLRTRAERIRRETSRRFHEAEQYRACGNDPEDAAGLRGEASGLRGIVEGKGTLVEAYFSSVTLPITPGRDTVEAVLNTTTIRGTLDVKRLIDTELATIFEPDTWGFPLVLS